MLHDILIPSRLRNYYLQSKRILSFEITPMMVQGLLIEFTGKTIHIKNKQSILLKDFSIQAQANALKKIASNIGKYDEIVTTLSSSAIIYKELTLPFIGRDALSMVVAYEVEALLPFALEEAAIDFIITKQTLEKKESTLLVAAVRMQDLQNHLNLFEKAELLIACLTIDIFALCEIYKAGICTITPPIPETANPLFDFKSASLINLWQTVNSKVFKQPTIQAPGEPVPTKFQPKQAELLIDIGCDVVRVLYFQDDVLSAVRMIPQGICDMVQTVSQKAEQPYFDFMQQVLTADSMHTFHESWHPELKQLFEEIARTLQFFEKQEASHYLKPHKILFSGFATNIKEFQEQAQTFFSNVIEIVDIQKITQRLHITTKSNDHGFSLLNLSLALFEHFEPNVNFLKSISEKNDNRLLGKQLLMMLCMTIVLLGTTFWTSSSILKEKEAAYNSSKRQFVQSIEQRMRLDLHNQKNIKEIVEQAETKLKSEKALWSAFSAQQEHSFLEYLQDLSTQIDRASIGLQVRSLHLDYENVSMTGSVKNFESLDVFEEELQSLQLLQLIEKPRELSFTIQFKPRENIKRAT